MDPTINMCQAIARIGSAEGTVQKCIDIMVLVNFSSVVWRDGLEKCSFKHPYFGYNLITLTSFKNKLLIK